MDINWKGIFENSNFWAVTVAKQGVERAQKKNKNLITVRCANTPTGVLHIGNANDVIRAYFVAKSIEVLGYNVRLVFTSDDRDPIRGFPKVIADKEGNLIEFPEDIKKEFEANYDGFPVFAIPDPFNCHSSWSEHFLSVYFNELGQLGIIDSIRFEYYSPNVLYHSGKWLHLVKKALEQKDKINQIYSKFKQHVREYPFAVICQSCGKIGTTHVISYNPETDNIRYICGSRHLKKKTVEGCGYEGETNIRFGKVDWYVEWAMDWAYFETDIEPMGKDHYTSSWRISPVIAREVFGVEEPIPVPYEFFTVDGKKMSGSKGNLWNITEFLKLVEPEVFLYLYTKRPMVERDIDLKNLYQLVNEFDELEARVYKTLEKIKNEEISIEDLKDEKFVSEKNLASFEDLTVYYLISHGRIENKKPIRIPYNFAAMIGQLILPKQLLEKTNVPLTILQEKDERFAKEEIDKTIMRIKNILIKTKHIDENILDYHLHKIIDRIRKAGYWAIKYGPDYIRVELNKEIVNVKLSKEEKETIKKIINFLESLEYLDIEILQTEIHNIIKNHTNPKIFYKKLYRMLLNKDRGPKIGSLIVAVGKEKILNILRQYL